MGKDSQGSYRDRYARGRDDEDMDYASSDSDYGAVPPRSSRSGMTPPNRGPGARSGAGGRSSAPSDPGNSSGRRGAAGGGLIRPPLPTAAVGVDDGRRAGPPPAAGRGGPRSVAGASREGNGSTRSRADYDESAEAPAASRGSRRSMASRARDMSRSMSRQLSAMMSRVGRSVRQDDSRVSRVAPPTPRRSPVPPEIAAEVAARPYRRSRARMITAKWRRSRVRPNPIAFAVGAMVAILLAVVLLVGGGAGMAYAVNYYTAHIGQVQAIAALRYNENSTIYDRKGKVIAVVKSNDSSYKFYNSLQDISPLVQWATIDTEDRTFYSNPGLDIVGTLRALLADVHSGGAATQGGSGITQQLVKIAVLDDASKALQRKINEAIISVGMTETQAYDKNFILEMYLNTISYGDQNTGIEAAARNYFGLQPDPTDPVTGKTTTANEKLDLAQTAILVALPNNPTEYYPLQFTPSCTKLPCTKDQWSNPWAPSQTCLTHASSFGPDWYAIGGPNGHEYLVYCRALDVLQNLKEYGTGNSGLHFTDAQFAAARNEVLSILENQQIEHFAGASNGSAADQTSIDKAPHFVQYVSQILSDDFGIDHLESAGLHIYTTLDLDLQNEVQTSIQNYVQKPYQNEWYDVPPAMSLEQRPIRAPK